MLITTFVDTTALMAAADNDDEFHQRSVDAFADLRRRRIPLLTSNYVVVEAYALIGRRLGLQAVRDLQATIIPELQVVWVGEAIHRRAVIALFAVNQRRLSLVDCVSFEVMRDLGITDVFIFDSDFERQGFRTVP